MNNGTNGKKDRLDRIEKLLQMAALQTAENAKHLGRYAKQADDQEDCDMEKPTAYSRELIERFRAQSFQREVAGRAPIDLEQDEVTLSCGHKKEISIHIIEAAAGKLTCLQCREEWLAKAAADGKPKDGASE